MKRAIVGRLNSTTQVLLVAAILATLNFLASRHFVRLDYTAEREYTLAPASRTVLAGLPDIVTIDVYFSRSIPPYLTTLRTRVQDLLDEYRAYGGRNIKVSVTAPDDDPGTEQKMRTLGIPRIQLNVLDKDQFQVSAVYMGLAVHHRAKKEVIPVLDGVENLEYQLTAAIVKVTQEAPVRVALAEGAAEEALARDGRESFGLLRRELDRQYELVPFDFAADQPVPEDLAVLIVAGPRALTPKDLFRLDQYVARGGKLVLLADAIELVPGSLDGRPMEHGLGPLLAAWGVDLKTEAVLDSRYMAPASFSNSTMTFRVPYPYWPDVHPQGFDEKSPIVNRLESLVLPWTSPVAPAAKLPDGLTATVLARSSSSSWTEKPPLDFDPSRERSRPDGGTSAQPLAVLLNGAFPSAFAGKIPPGVPPEEAEAFRSAGAATAVLVTGTSRFIQDGFVEQFPSNGIFILNAVDWLARGRDLIGIRSRGATGAPLPELSAKARAIIRYLNIFGLAALFLVYGAVRLSLRRYVPRRFR